MGSCVFFDLRALVFGALFAILAPGAASAGIETIRSEDNSLWLASGAAHLIYSEQADNGTNLDTERGWLPAVSGGVSVLGGGVLPSNLYLALDADGLWGNVRYSGSLVGGAPFTGTTNETIWSVHTRAGWGFALNSATMLIPYVTLGYRHWDRDSGGFSERYHNFDALGGLLAQYSPRPAWVFSLWGAVGSVFSGAMTATAPTMHFDLGNGLIWRVGAKAGYSLLPQLELFGRIGYERLAYGRSQNVLNPADGLYYYEPESRTSTVTTQLGLAYRFR